MENSRAYHIRLKIDQLKRELAAIEEENLSPDEKTDSATAMTCGHDVIIDNLRSTARRLEQNGRAVLACWQKDRGGSGPCWYSTTITPEIIPYDIQDVSNLVTVLELFSDRSVLTLTQLLFEHENGLTPADLSNIMNLSLDEISMMTSRLSEQDYTSESEGKWFLKLKGWQFFIVISHLIWYQNLKLAPAKALEIVPAFQDVFGIYWGEYLGKDEDTALEELELSGWLGKLYEKGLIREDICKAMYEHNYEQNNR